MIEDPPLPVDYVCDRLEDADSIEVLEVLRNVIHWSDVPGRNAIVDALSQRISRILEDHA